MKKLIILIAMLLTACSAPKVQTFEQYFIDAGMTKVEKLIIQDGSTGYSKTTSDQQLIEQLLNEINPIQVIPQDNQEQRDGWRYAITFVQGNSTYSFILNNIEGIYYDSEPDIHPIVEAFYQNLDAEEK